MAVLLAGLAASLLGVGDFVAGLGSRRTDHPGAAMSIAWLASVVGAAVAGVFVLVVPPEAFGRSDMLWTLGATVFVSFARPLLYLGMERGPMVVFSPVVAIVSLVVPSIIGPLTGQSLLGLELAGVLIAFPAVLLIVSGGELSPRSLVHSRPALVLGAITGALIGGASLCFAQIDPDAGAMPAFVSQLGAVLLIPLITRPIRPMSKLDREVVRVGVAVGLIDIVAIIASVIAFQRANVAVVAAIMGFAPAITIALAWRILHERVRGWQWVGAALASGAIVLFAVGA